MPLKHRSVASHAPSPARAEGASSWRAPHAPRSEADLAQRWVGNSGVGAGLAAPSGLNALLAGRSMLAAAGVQVPDATFASNTVMRRALGRASSGQVDFGTEVGEPLPAAVQARMEQTFGHNFAHVRIHTGARAGEAAAALNAEAVTRGAHIYFGRGAWRPGSPDGDRLLLHELTHVLQGDEGRLPGAGVSEPGDAAEQEAYANEVRLRVGPTEDMAAVKRPGGAAGPLPSGGAVLRREAAEAESGGGASAGAASSGTASSASTSTGTASSASTSTGTASSASTSTGTASSAATSTTGASSSRAASQAASTSRTTASGTTTYSSRAGYQAAGASSAGYATATAFAVPAGGTEGAASFATWVGELRKQVQETVGKRREALEEARTWAKEQITTRLQPARERIGAAYDGAVAQVEESFAGARQDIEGQRNTSRAEAIAAGVLAAMTFEGQRDAAYAALDALAQGKTDAVRGSARSAADRLAADYARIRENARSNVESAAAGSAAEVSAQELGGALAEVDGAFERAATDASAAVVAQGEAGAEQIAQSRDAVRKEYDDAFGDHADQLSRAFAAAVDEVMQLSLDAQTSLSEEKVELLEALADSRSEEERALDDLEAAATDGVDEGIDTALGVLTTYEEQLLSDIDVVEDDVGKYAAVPEAMAALVPAFGENVATCMDNLERYMVDAENTLRTDTQALCGEGEGVADAAESRTAALVTEVASASDALRTEVPGQMTAAVDATIGLVGEQTAGLFERVAARQAEVDAAWTTTIADATATLDGRVADNVASVERTATSMISDLSEQFAAAPDTDQSVLEQVGDAAKAVADFAGGLVQGLASGLWDVMMGFLDALKEPLTWVVVGLAVAAALAVGWPVVVGAIVVGGIALTIKPTADAITEDLRVLFDGDATAAERGRALGETLAQLVQFLPVVSLVQEMRAAQSFVVLEELTEGLGGIGGLQDGLDFANSIDALQGLLGRIGDGETALYLMDVTGDLATLEGLLDRADAGTLASLLREVPDVGTVGELLATAQGDPADLVAIARLVPDDAQLAQLVAKVPDLCRLQELLQAADAATVLALAGYALDAERMTVWVDTLGADAAAAVLAELPAATRQTASTLGAEWLEQLLDTPDPAKALELYATYVETCEMPTDEIVARVVGEVG